jgi:hypothetical protein
MELLRNIDLQSFNYEFTVDKNSSFKTALGGCLIVLLIVISVLAFVAFGRDFINKTSPTIYSSYSKTDNPVIPKSQFKGYRIAGAAMYRGGASIEDQDRILEIQSLTGITNPANEVTTVFTPYFPDVCIERKNYTDSETQDLRSNFIGKPETYKCLSEKIDHDINGSFGNPVFTIWMFTINRCANSTQNNNHCFPDEVINQRLEEFYLHLIFEEYYINSNDYEAPLKRYYNKKLITLSARSTRIDTLYFRSFEYISDNGFLIESKQSYFGHELVNHEKEYHGVSGVAIYGAFFTCDNLNHQIYRIYIKVQKVIADTGGIIKFFSLLFSVIGNRYSMLKFYDYMIKRVISTNKFEKNKIEIGNNVSFFNFILFR